MINQNFHIEVIGNIALMTIQGEWTMETAIAYKNEVFERLEVFKQEHDIGFAITSLKYWSIPSLEILAQINAVIHTVTQNIKFTHNALIAPKKQQTLFEEVVNEFTFENLKVEAKAFLNLEEALVWSKKLGYDINKIPVDYFEQLYKLSLGD